MAKSSVKSGVVGAIDYLARPQQSPVTNVCVVFGDDAFLKAEVLKVLAQETLGGNDGEFGLTTIPGQDARLVDVRDALSSISLFGTGARMVIVENADPFVTEYRSELEDYVAAPARGLLVLDVKTWPGNIRLAK